MRFPILGRLLLDCTGVKGKVWFYSIGCFVSGLAVLNSFVALVSFFVDYRTRAPIYHSLPTGWYSTAYVSCLLLTLVTSVLPLLLGMAALSGDVSDARGTYLGRLARVAGFEDFYIQSGLTRYLLLTTLSAAAVILFNTISVATLHLGIGSLFQSHWSSRIASVDCLQGHYACCGPDRFSDWLSLAGKLPPSCADVPLGRNDASPVGSSGNRTRVHEHGCVGPATSEQAVVCGIGNALVFAGALLLVAAWARTERLHDGVKTAQELKATTFKHPRSTGDAAAFLESRRSNQFAPRHSTSHHIGVDRRPSDSSSGTRAANLGRFRETRLQLSEGYLRPPDGRDAKPARAAPPKSSDSDVGSQTSTNNSALDQPVAQWLRARVVNSAESAAALEQAWRVELNTSKDSVQLVNELHRSRQPLDPVRLPQPSPTRCRPMGSVVRCFVTRQRPLLLEEFLAAGCHRRAPFVTAVSGCWQRSL